MCCGSYYGYINLILRSGGNMSRVRSASRRGVSYGLITLGLLLIVLGTTLHLPSTHAQSNASLSELAQDLFWDSLLSDDYDRLPEVTNMLTAAYLENPHDGQIALLLGMAHLWTITESDRLPEVKATITDELILAEAYFEQAMLLNPDDARILGWLSSVRIALASIRQNDADTIDAYMGLMEAAMTFPEFNLFTKGFALSQLPVTNPRYSEAVDDMWASLDACFGEQDRTNPSFAPFTSDGGPDRVCVNSDIAPHNFEGFVLNMGNMLLKQGNVELARLVYARAALSESYDQWPFRAVLEDHMARAEEITASFQSQDPASEGAIPMMINAEYGCVACHASSN
jgi:hypothetical protein